MNVGIALSVLQLFLYANWWDSNWPCIWDFNSQTINFSRHFVTLEVRATGLLSLFSLGTVFYGSGVMIDFQKSVDSHTVPSLWKTAETQAGVSSSVHVFKRKAETSSGTVALLMIIVLKKTLWHQSSVVMVLMIVSSSKEKLCKSYLM